MPTWYTAPASGPELDRLLTAWPDAPFEQLEVLGMLLEVAQEQVIEYGPTLAEGAPIPSRFVLGQLRQAQALWDEGRTDGDGQIGDGAFVFTPRPMDKKIRGIIRPTNGKPRVY